MPNAETTRDGFPKQQLCPGFLLVNRYLIEKEIDVGGIGALFLARGQQLLERPVVIKVLLEHSTSDPLLQKKFRQEMEALARIDHPGVIGVLDAGELPGGKQFLVIQFVEGKNLRSILQNLKNAGSNGMDFERPADLVREIGNALSTAHQKGGDHVRLSIEAARTGYLYVVNREQYEDGSLGEPFLIFPRTRTIGGNNQTAKGRVIEIPDQMDNPPYFTFRPGRPDQVGELLSIIATASPLAELKIGSRPLKLSTELVNQWEKSWGGTLGRLEMAGGTGQTWTEAEKQAGSGSKLLAAGDPKLQTLFFKPDAKPADALLVNIRLRYAQAMNNNGGTDQ